ncbi:MAG: radical SAM protein, partial [Bacteroides sp.]
IGFYSTTVTTNAQMPFGHCTADSIWVSLDGLNEFHDDIRGKGAFERLLLNIDKCGHPALSVNMVINTHNYHNVKDTIIFAKNHPAIRSISLNFHTPYEGTEELYLDQERRNQIIDLILHMKKEGYPIMNSRSGLKLMRDNHFEKQCWVSNFILADGTRLDECAGKALKLCDKCGFCMAGEMHSVMALKPDTLLEAIKLRMS